MHDKKLLLRDVWRTCNKIRAAIFRIKGLNLNDYFKPLDPNRNCLISESQFVSVLAGQLRGPIGLSDQEIGDLADYFRVQDGRIFYTQLCDVIHTVAPDFSKNKDLCSGLEWEDPLHTNRVSVSDQRRLCLLIAKIATVVNMRRLVLRPYFQDYELIAKNVGTVTISHFARILSYLNILVSAADFNLLIKKYIKDSYTINYVAFIKDIDNAVKYMDDNGMLDIGGDLVSLFPGRVISAELPKLPRPEIGKIHPASIFGKQTVFHPVLAGKPEQEALHTVIRRIQEHVFSNRLRVNEFFKDYDPLNSGRCKMSQFRKGLDKMGVSALGRLYISPPEYDAIMVQYRDPTDPDRVCWETFETDIDTVFTTRELEKYPTLGIVSPPKEVTELPRKGGQDWQTVNTELRDMCEEVVEKVKKKADRRRVLLKPSFGDYDRNNNGHVTRAQMRQCLLSNGMLLSEEEMFALEQRFNDDVGFNYNWFLKELDTKPTEPPLFVRYVDTMKKLNATKPPPHPDGRETDIIMILAKLKGKLVRDRVRPMEFLRTFDKQSELVITHADFKRGLDNCGFQLTCHELCTLIDVFKSPGRPRFVDYKRFCDVIEEAFTQTNLERAPLIIPIQHIPTKDCDRNFLDFEERHRLSMALQKLAKKPDMTMNLMAVFKDFDRTNIGTVSRSQFLKTLAMRGMMRMISTPEFEVVCKCFSFERGMRDEVDYRAFCKSLDLLYTTARENPI